MKVQLQKSYPVAASADAAWKVLEDIKKLAACMPGAAITERIDDRNFKGTVAVKFGPASMAFRGEIQLAEVTPDTRSVRLVGKGVDNTGSSGAAMDLTARIDAVDAGACTLIGTSEVSVSGKAAAFGGRMMGSVADQVLKQFAENFAIQAQQQTATPTATSPDPPASPATPAQAGVSGAEVTTPRPVAAPPLSGGADVLQPAAAAQLDGLALAWAVLKGWLRSLFAPGKA
jgi:carbon monoxide dehydrogenase subunit G